MKKKAKVVDSQNLKDPSMKGHSPYQAMSGNFDRSLAFRAGRAQSNRWWNPSGPYVTPGDRKSVV